MAMAGALFTLRPWTLALEAACLWGWVLAAGLTRPWVRFLRVGSPMIILVLGVALLALGWREAVLLSLRLVILFTVSFLLFQAVPAEEMGPALTRLGAPPWFSFVLTTALRYVPLLGVRVRHVMDAQRSRGIDLRPRPGNARNLSALVVPVIIQSFALADDLAVAMESRGFARAGRTCRRVLRMAPWEYALLGVGLAGLAGLIWWETGGVP
jgi:energy-coupling factor transport system permease protein